MWQPIKTAPEYRWVVVTLVAKNGHSTLPRIAYKGSSKSSGKRRFIADDEWIGFHPTHWMPLPDPPQK